MRQVRPGGLRRLGLLGLTSLRASSQNVSTKQLPPGTHPKIVSFIDSAKTLLQARGAQEPVLEESRFGLAPLPDFFKRQLELGQRILRGRRWRFGASFRNPPSHARCTRLFGGRVVGGSGAHGTRRSVALKCGPGRSESPDSGHRHERVCLCLELRQSKSVLNLGAGNFRTQWGGRFHR
jgi:hypothetical protein